MMYRTLAGSTFDFTGNLDTWFLGHLLFAAAGFLAVLAVRGPHRIEAGFNSVLSHGRPSRWPSA